MKFKTWLIINMVSFRGLFGFAQDSFQPELLFIGKVPVYFYHEGQGLELNDSLILKVPPGKLGIKPASYPFSRAARSLFIGVDKPLGLKSSDINIYVTANDRVIVSFQKLCTHLSVATCEEQEADITIDILPNTHYTCILSTSLPDSISCVFYIYSANEKPPLLGWRTLKEPDKLKGHEPLYIIQATHADKIFTPPSDIIQAGHEGYLQFKFKQPVPWADSFLQYHWSTDTLNSPVTWSIGGGLLTLPYSGRPRHWYLKVKYKGQNHTTLYKIVLEPKWYERTGFLLLFGFLFTLLAGLAYYIFYTRKLRLMIRSETQLSQQLLSMQANITPHLLLNAMAALHDLVESARWGEVKIYVAKLALFLQDAFANRAQVYINLEREMAKIRDFVSIQQLRFGFDFKEDLPENLQAANIDLPNGLFQPLVENAIKYNFSGLHNQNSMHINLVVDGSNLLIKITGICHSPGCLEQRAFRHSTGFGLTWVDKRIAIHNKMNPSKKITLKLLLGTHQSEALFTCYNHINETYV